MGFIMDGLDSEAYDRNYTDKELIRRVLTYFRPYTKRLLLVAAAISLNSLSATAGPILVARGLDIVTTNPSNQVFLLLTGGVLLLGLSAWIFNFIQQWFSARVVGDVVLEIRKDVFDATIRHDMSFFDEFASGKIVSRVTSDTQDLSDVVTLTTSLLSQILLVIILTFVLLRISVPLTLLLLALTPIAALIALSFRHIARRITQQARRATAEINALIQESVSGIMVAKGFRQEAAIHQEFQGRNEQAYQIGLRQGFVFNSIFPLLGASSGIGSAILLLAGGVAAQRGVLTPGDWYLFMQAVGFFWWPLISIASFWSQFQNGLSAAERVFALIDTEPKVVQIAKEPVTRLEGAIQFEDVKFAYVPEEGAARSDEVVLSAFSLAIRPHETVALVGHTGAGKSSVGKLVSRFYEYQDGRLTVDGKDIRTLDLAAYRRQVGVVPQEPFLFSGTVRDNIRYSRPEAGDDEVLAAAQQIGGGDWVADLQSGLDTDVGERGANLSMGQRQLVALARVVLKDPAIFILDEATASVDPFTEAQIQDGLTTLMEDRTAIVIAHRLSTVKNADRIIVMDHGRIIEEGTHDGLMATAGHYAELYNTYFRHQSPDYKPFWVPEDEPAEFAS